MMVQMGSGPGDEPDEMESFETEALEEDQLTLASESESLPWLEPDYEDEEEGFDTGRIIGFVMLALLALAAILALFWWLSNRSPDPDLVADGSTIEAPDGPVKERPEDAGGKTFEGTGSLAPAVGEGETRETRLGGGEAPGPSTDTTTGGASAAGASAAGTGAQANAGAAQAGVGVQIGAYSSKASAEAGWSRLAGQTEALKGVRYRIEQGTADIGTVFRLQAVAADAASARALCNALKADGIACQVKR